MKEIFEVFAPSGSEEAMVELLKKRFSGMFDRFEVDNMGNLSAVSGEGSLCIECGMDSVGVMITAREDNCARFAPVGGVKVCDVLGRTMIFGDGSRGKVCCDEGKDQKDAKLSDLFIEFKEIYPPIGDFGVIEPEYNEEDCAVTGYGIQNRIGLAAVCKAIEETRDLGDVTVLFSAQKRLGARGLTAYFRVHSFDAVITVDKSGDDGCTIVAKDERAVADRDLRMRLEKIAEEKDIFAETVVSDSNFCMENISVSCGDPCIAIGISVLTGEGEPERVSRSDFGGAVKLLAEIMKERGR